jgi:hypothetical protein
VQTIKGTFGYSEWRETLYGTIKGTFGYSEWRETLCGPPTRK